MSKTQQMRTNIFAGVGLGLLIGTIIGLSIAEVTGIILGGLTSLLSAFFGLRSTKEGETGNQIIIGTFSITCIFATLLGIYMRTHNLLSPSLAWQINEYKAKPLELNDELIKTIILFRETGLIPDGYSIAKDNKPFIKDSILMASKDKSILLCDEIDDTSSLMDIKKAFNESGGTYKKIEEYLSSAITDQKKLSETLQLVKTGICRQ